MTLRKYRLFLTLLIACLGVTFDLTTTFIGINFFGCYEVNALGYQPLLEYITVLGFVFLSYCTLEHLYKIAGSDHKLALWLGNFLNVITITLPYYAGINNIRVILTL